MSHYLYLNFPPSHMYPSDKGPFNLPSLDLFLRLSCPCIRVVAPKFRSRRKSGAKGAVNCQELDRLAIEDGYGCRLGIEQTLARAET